MSTTLAPAGTTHGGTASAADRAAIGRPTFTARMAAAPRPHAAAAGNGVWSVEERWRAASAVNQAAGPRTAVRSSGDLRDRRRRHDLRRTATPAGRER